MKAIESRVARAEAAVLWSSTAEDALFKERWADPRLRTHLILFALHKEAAQGGHAIRDILLRAKRQLDREQGQATNPLAELLEQ